LFVYGSEFNKGTKGMGLGGGTNDFQSVEPSFKSFRSKMLILKDTV
jgi:hypothetical protein